MHEHLLELLHTLPGFRHLRRVLVGNHLYLRQHIENVNVMVTLGSAQPVLVKDVIREGEYIGLRHPNRLHISYSQEPKEDFLDEVGRIRRISYASEQKAPQPLAVLSGASDDESLLLLGVHDGIPDEHTAAQC